MIQGVATESSTLSFLSLIREFKIELSDLPNLADIHNIERRLDELEHHVTDLEQNRIWREHSETLSHTFGIITQDFEDNMRCCLGAWRRRLYEPMTNIVESHSDDEHTPPDGLRLLRLLCAYAQGLRHFKTVLVKYSILSDRDDLARHLDVANIRRRAPELLHEILLHGCPRPLRTHRVKQGKEQTTQRSIPATSITSGARYGEDENQLLVRLEQSYQNATQFEHLSPVNQTVWLLRHIIYWSAQVVELFERMQDELSHGNPFDFLRHGSTIRNQFLLASLRTMWLAHIDVDNADLSRTKPFLFEVAGLCISETCERIHEFFGQQQSGSWKPYELLHFQTSHFELRLPHMGDSIASSRDSSQNSITSTSMRHHGRALTNDSTRGLTRDPISKVSSFDEAQTFSPNTNAVLHSQSASRHAHQHDRTFDRHHIRRKAVGSPPHHLRMFEEVNIPHGDNHVTLVPQALQSTFNNRNTDHLSARSPPPTQPFHVQLSSLSLMSPHIPYSTWDEIQIAHQPLSDGLSFTANPFQCGLFTHDREPEFASRWMPSRISVFRASSEQGEVLRIHTERPPWTPHDSQYILSNTEMVPQYAYEPLGQRNQQIYLRCGGSQSGLNFRFFSGGGDQPIVSPEDFLAFQSALLGTNFEVEYPIIGVCLVSSNCREKLKPVRLQMWKDDKEQRKTRRKSSYNPQVNAVQEATSRLPRNIPLQDSFEDYEGSKLLIFADGSIYVLPITNRTVCERTKSQKILRLLPNKQLNCSDVRVRKLQGTPNAPAGIPLDQAGMGFCDMDGTQFSAYKSVEIQFSNFRSDANLVEFEKDFILETSRWAERIPATRKFRENERRSRIVTKSVVRLSGGKK